VIGSERFEPRGRLHTALTGCDLATTYLRDAGRSLDRLLADGGLDQDTTEQLIMLGDQLLAASDIARGFATAIAGIDARFRGARDVTAPSGGACG
jgi:hypothetical protein